jgi:hypothetical protein
MTAFNLGQLLGVLFWVVLIAAIARDIMKRRRAKGSEL